MADKRINLLSPQGWHCKRNNEEITSSSFPEPTTSGRMVLNENPYERPGTSKQTEVINWSYQDSDVVFGIRTPSPQPSTSTSQASSLPSGRGFPYKDHQCGASSSSHLWNKPASTSSFSVEELMPASSWQQVEEESGNTFSRMFSELSYLLMESNKNRRENGVPSARRGRDCNENVLDAISAYEEEEEHAEAEGKDMSELIERLMQGTRLGER